MSAAFFIDLSKTLDFLNHELLIARLEAYGFDFQSLTYIFSCLSNRKQTTKVNKIFRAWSVITSGVPHGSILGILGIPLIITRTKSRENL